MVAKGLAGVNVGHVHFINRALEDGQRVADAIAVMRPGASIDQHGSGSIAMRSMNALAHGTFKIGLETLDAGTQIVAERRHRCVDLGQRDGAVLRRIALAEHVEIDAVEQENSHENFFGSFYGSLCWGFHGTLSFRIGVTRRWLCLLHFRLCASPVAAV